MWEIAIWFFIILYVMNGFCLYLVDATGYSMLNPFTNSTIVFPNQPTPITTLQNINTSTATNSTGGASVGIWDAANYAWNSTIFMANLLTGGFIFQVILALVPSTGSLVIATATIQGTVAVFLIITVVHFWRAIF